MRIAVFHNLPSGGGKRALFEATRRISLNHEVDVYTLSSAEHNFCDVRPYVHAHHIYPFAPFPLARRPFGRLNQAIRSLDLLRLSSLQQEIACLIETREYDLLLAHNCQFGQSPAILVSSATPSVYYCQEPPRTLYEPAVPRPYSRHSRWQEIGNLVDPLPSFYRRVLRQKDRANVQAASLVLVNSAYSRESLYRAYGVFAKTSYLGIDTKLFCPRFAESGDFVISVGALIPRKGFDFIIRSLALLRDQERPRLVIVSNYADPREKEYLTSLAQIMRVELTLLERISDTELVDLYNRARLTVYTPILEPFGFVPLESMACATPVIAVNEGGIRETIRHGETGLLTERDTSEFAAGIAELLGNEGRRRSYGEAGRAYVERAWGWDRSVSLLEQHLASVLP